MFAPEVHRAERLALRGVSEIFELACILVFGAELWALHADSLLWLQLPTLVLKV